MDTISSEELARLRKDNKGPTTTAVCAVFTLLAFIFVALRLFTRVKLVRHVGAEDYCIAASMFFSIAMGVLQILQVHSGVGKHQILLSLEQITFILKYLYFSILSYCLTLALTRVSILLQFRRIFVTLTMRVITWFGIVTCVSYSIGYMFVGIFTCVPIDGFWDPTKATTAKCLNRKKLAFVNVSFNIAFDLYVAALPIKCIWDLHLPRRQKIALVVILTLGWFVCIVSILRLHAMMVFSKHPEDATWYSSEAAYWSSIEVNLAIVCASMPCLKPLAVRLFPTLFSHQHSYGTDRSKHMQVSSSRKFVELEEMSNSGVVVEEIQRNNNRKNSMQKDETGPAVLGNNIRITTEFQIEEANQRPNDQGSEKGLIPPLSHRDI